MRTIKNVPVCVVGGAGFLGSHLTNYLIERRGCKVVVIDNLSSGRREFIHPKAMFEHHDITGSEHYLRGIFAQHKVEYVFNYAAMPYIPVSFERPVYVADLNYLGALRVINAAQESGCKGILQVSSAEIYGEAITGGTNGGGTTWTGQINESFPVTPHSTYGASKAAIDMTVQARWKEAKTPCIALRQFNCVGERETHPYIVPEIISQLAKQGVTREFYGVARGLPTKIEYSGTGMVELGNNSFRDFLYAGDAVRIAVELLEKGQFGEVYNLGSETGIKMYDLAKLIGKLMGFDEVVVEQDPNRVRPWEIWHLQSDNTKIKSVTKDTTGSAGLTTLEEALKLTIADYVASGRKWAWE